MKFMLDAKISCFDEVYQLCRNKWKAHLDYIIGQMPAQMPSVVTNLIMDYQTPFQVKQRPNRIAFFHVGRLNRGRTGCMPNPYRDNTKHRIVIAPSTEPQILTVTNCTHREKMHTNLSLSLTSRKKEKGFWMPKGASYTLVTDASTFDLSSNVPSKTPSVAGFDFDKGFLQTDPCADKTTREFERMAVYWVDVDQQCLKVECEQCIMISMHALIHCLRPWPQTLMLSLSRTLTAVSLHLRVR